MPVVPQWENEAAIQVGPPFCDVRSTRVPVQDVLRHRGIVFLFEDDDGTAISTSAPLSMSTSGITVVPPVSRPPSSCQRLGCIVWLRVVFGSGGVSTIGSTANSVPWPTSCRMLGAWIFVYEGESRSSSIRGVEIPRGAGCATGFYTFPGMKGGANTRTNSSHHKNARQNSLKIMRAARAGGGSAPARHGVERGRIGGGIRKKKTSPVRAALASARNLWLGLGLRTLARFDDKADRARRALQFTEKKKCIGAEAGYFCASPTVLCSNLFTSRPAALASWLEGSLTGYLSCLAPSSQATNEFSSSAGTLLLL
ncbi:hypothetical protein C8R45DRAFT_938675 [Mycena sanguinolenta]|nr:hypothetical protein C8R45DRAFT_938675 [Mycena sanguinolenta]